MIFYLPNKRGRIKALMPIICFLFLPTSLLANQFKVTEVYRGEPPKDLNLDPFFKAERQSRAEKKGIWIQGDGYVNPRTWHKRQRAKSACAMMLFGICEQKGK